MDATPRDHIYAVIQQTDNKRITKRIVQQESDVELSDYTIYNTLMGLTDAGVLTHQPNSPYWYIL